MLYYWLLGSSGPLSPRSMSARKTEIEKERARLLASKDMAQEDRDKVQKVLQHKEDELRLASEQQQRLERKLQDLNSKVSTCTVLTLSS